jgi:aminoglycoside phosphotransferase (APT) family kinase protein
VTEPWTAERVVDASLARDLIELQFPELAPVSVKLLGLGFDNTAYLVGGQWVFRLPRRELAVALIEQEVRLLPALAPAPPLPVPVPECLGHPEERFPWPFVGYRLLSGRTACGLCLDEAQRGAMARPLGRFLIALHAFPVRQAEALGARGDVLAKMDVRVRTPVTQAGLAELRGLGLVQADELRRLERVLAEAPVDAVRPPATVVHGDLYVRHLLVDDEGHLTGVIDWGNVHIGDRAVDLSVAYGFLPPAAREVLGREYDEDEVTWRLARFRALCHATSVVRYAHRVGDADLLREGRLALGWVADG